MHFRLDLTEKEASTLVEYLNYLIEKMKAGENRAVLGRINKKLGGRGVA